MGLNRNTRYLIVFILLCGWRPSFAQPASPKPETPSPGAESGPYVVPNDVKIAISKALLSQGRALLAAGQVDEAKKLLVEGLSVSPNGPMAAATSELLQKANAQLGLEANAGDPRATPSADSQVSESVPMDPYAKSAAVSEKTAPLDPYAATATAKEKPVPNGDAVSTETNRSRDRDGLWGTGNPLLGWGGVYGFTVGLAVAGPTDENDNRRSGAIFLGALGAAAGFGGVYLFQQSVEVEARLESAIVWGGAWGSAVFGVLGDLVTGVDTSTTTDIVRSAALGGAAGTVGGFLYSRMTKATPAEIGFVSSIGLYGASTGVLIGAIIQPPESEAYSLNAALGATSGLVLGHFLRSRIPVSRRRMMFVDAGAAAGALAPWALLYPLIRNTDGTSDEVAAGVLSTVGLFGGAYLVWRFTDQMVADGGATSAVSPALLQRSAHGRWGMGPPLFRRMNIPALSETSSFGVDVLSGSF